MSEAGVHYNQGVTHYRNNRFLEAKDSFLRAHKLAPLDPQISKLLAMLLANFGEFSEARKHFEVVLNNSPVEPPVQFINNYARLLEKLGEVEDAISVYRKIVARSPDYGPAWMNLGECYRTIKQLLKAKDCYEKLYALEPDSYAALRGLSYQYHSLCLWDEAEMIDNKLVGLTLREQKEGEESPLNIHTAFSFVKDAEFVRTVAVKRSEMMLSHNRKKGVTLGNVAKIKKDNKRIRVGYLSAALSRHATAYLIHGMFGHHNLDKFEISVFATNVRRPCEYYDFIENSGVDVYDLSLKNDLEIGRFIRSHDLDVLIDVDGVITNNKQGLLSLGLAPVQIAWLGTPATSGASWIDYILTDNVTSPPEFKDHYSEEILPMPDSYFFNSFSSMDVDPSSKSDWSLPEDKFIFASFNLNYKIDRESVTAWCEILNAVPESVLWILIDDLETFKNLSAFMSEKGVDPSRLIVANRVSSKEHLSRLGNADLLLDCFIHGAHTTCVEALYMELPVITLMGETFYARVASSILSAAKMESCITTSIKQYVERAIEIGKNEDMLRELKNHLRDNKGELPIFDQKKWVTDLEDILCSIVEK